MYRFMTAWDHKDIQGVLDAMSAGQRTHLYLSETSTQQHVAFARSRRCGAGRCSKSWRRKQTLILAMCGRF